MPRGDKHGNEYADKVRAIYHDTPKAVFAAVAVSVLTQGGDYLDESLERFAEEWVVLHEQGIVPQRPPAKVRAIAAQREREREAASQ